MKKFNSLSAKTSTPHHVTNSCGSGKYQILVSMPLFQYSHFPPNGKRHTQTLIMLLQSLVYRQSSPNEVWRLIFESTEIFSGCHLTVNTWGRAKPAPAWTKKPSRVGWQAPSFACQTFLWHGCPPEGSETAQIKTVAGSRIEGLSRVRESRALWSWSSLNLFFLHFSTSKTGTLTLLITSVTLPAVVDFCWPLWMQYHSTRNLSTATVLTPPFPSASQSLSIKKCGFLLQLAFVTCNS